MSAPLPSPLRRADPLLNSNGRPNAELANYVNSADRNGAHGPQRNVQRATSFRRTLQGLKDRSMAIGHSRSVCARKTRRSEAPIQRRGHLRLLTDVSDMLPNNSQNAPPVKSMDCPPSMDFEQQATADYFDRTACTGRS